MSTACHAQISYETIGEILEHIKARASTWPVLLLALSLGLS